ncbi:hypothetical protein GR268_45645, partial [Rhizobium leguminosarum]|nr:hypothetical protein [Rhizobium leguminosarum]
SSRCTTAAGGGCWASDSLGFACSPSRSMARAISSNMLSSPNEKAEGACAQAWCSSSGFARVPLAVAVWPADNETALELNAAVAALEVAEGLGADGTDVGVDRAESSAVGGGRGGQGDEVTTGGTEGDCFIAGRRAEAADVAAAGVLARLASRLA